MAFLAQQLGQLARGSRHPTHAPLCAPLSCASLSGGPGGPFARRPRPSATAALGVQRSGHASLQALILTVRSGELGNRAPGLRAAAVGHARAQRAPTSLFRGETPFVFISEFTSFCVSI